MWFDEHLAKKNDHYYKFEYVNQKESTPIEEVFIVLTTNFLKCKITVFSYKNIWSTDESKGLDIVLALFSENKLSNTQVGTYYFLDLLIICTTPGKDLLKVINFQMHL